MLVSALLYDGKSSKEHNVIIDFTFGRRVKIASHNIDVSLDEVKILSRLGNTPRILEFPNGERCKSEENDKIDQVLRDFNINKSKTHKIESSLVLTLGSVFLTISFVWFILTGGANYSANFLASILPQNSLDNMSQITLNQLKGEFLKPSKLSERQERIIQEHFNKLTHGEKKYKLHFHSAPEIGANAFALPSGDIVLTDQLVALSRDNDFRDILGVLAHEKGHVVGKHSLRMAIKTALSGVIIGYVTGDISIVATTLPTVLLNSSYSRDFEREADAYALKELDALGISTKYMAHLFEVLAEKHGDSENGIIASMIQSHPLTSERINYFKEHSNSKN